MRRPVIGLTFLAALALPAWADDKPPTEDEKLIGTWNVVALSFGDMKLGLPEGNSSFTFSKGGKVVAKLMGKPDTEGAYKVGLAKTPREIDITAPLEPGKKAETMKGIYQVDGDTLKMNFAKAPEGERPTAFDSKTTRTLHLERKKP
jgi:uncharacterized protein (TIGR03067 family)